MSIKNKTTKPKYSFGCYENELREKWPDRAQKAKEGSRKEAIHLFCMNCMGGSSQEAAKCTATYCFLHPYRPGT